MLTNAKYCKHYVTSLTNHNENGKQRIKCKIKFSVYLTHGMQL
jgi:hypothetical protein